MSYRTRGNRGGQSNQSSPAFYTQNTPQRYQPQQQQYQSQSQQFTSDPVPQFPETNLVKTTANAKQYNIPQPTEPQPQIPLPPIQQADTSATTKALKAMEPDNGEDTKRTFTFKKTKRLSYSVRKRNISARLSNYVVPRSAVCLINEFRPGCVIKVVEQPHPAMPGLTTYMATVEHEGKIIGSAQSKVHSDAKGKAAENAIQNIVSETLKESKVKQEQSGGAQQSDDPMGEDGEPVRSKDDPIRKLPWVDLASFALYKMFSDWNEVPITPRKSRKSASSAVKEEKKRELPANALELHPVSVLVSMHPGILPVEISKVPHPTPSTTVGFQINGVMYTGTAQNKKLAKKEAAKDALKALYGLEYTN